MLSRSGVASPRASRDCSATRGCRTPRPARGTSSAGSRRSTRGTSIPHRSLLLIGAMVLFWSFFGLDDDHHGADRDAHPGAVRRPGVRGDAAAEPATGPAAAVADVALPAAVPGRAGRLAVRLRGTGRLFIVIGVATLLLGAVVFLIWSKRRGDWPSPRLTSRRDWRSDRHDSKSNQREY